MNAEQVVEKILSQARGEADTILGEAKAKADAQAKQTQAELAEFNKQTQTLARAAADDKVRRMLAQARMAHARQLLGERGEVLDGIFAKALDKLNQLPDEQYLALMKKLMTRAVETGDEEVVVGKNEKRINEDFVKKVNRDLGTGFKGSLKLSSRRADITGGFLLSHGRVQANVSSEVLIGQARERMEIELANELFGSRDSTKQG
ncbi:MAG: V-type ATP synthase subunit E [Planctomycetaceae bacterium]|nr:V-type ATP synthase subunit E [Planctomycetaceae bacterium]